MLGKTNVNIPEKMTKLYMRRKKYALKIASFITAIIFLFSNSNLALAKPYVSTPDTANVAEGLREGGSSLLDVEEVELPQEIGRVTEVHKGTSDKTIIYIQDLHANYSAQKSLAGIMNYLIGKHNISVVLVEGGITDNDFSYIRNGFPIEFRERKAEELLKEGVITGEEYVDIAGIYDLKFQGIEDQELYERNMEAFLEVDRFKEEALTLAGHFKGIAKNLKMHIYDKALKEFDSKRKDYQDDKLEFTDYVEYLKGTSLGIGLRIEDYPNLTFLTKTIEIEKEVDFDNVESERAELIDALTKGLSGDDVNKLIQYSLDYKQGKIKQLEFYDFLVLLTRKSEEIDIATFPNLKSYIEYIRNYNEVKPTALFQEVMELEDSLEFKLCKNEDQKNLVGLHKHVNLLERFLKLELSPRDWRYYESNKNDFDVNQWGKFLELNAQRFGLSQRPPDDLSILTGNFGSLEKFYKTVVERDQAFLRNSLAKLEKENENKAIFIAGGFHAGNFTELLREEGLSYLIVIPKISGEVDHEKYRSILKNSYSSRTWKSLKSERGDIDKLREIRSSESDLGAVNRAFNIATFRQTRELMVKAGIAQSHIDKLDEMLAKCKEWGTIKHVEITEDSSLEEVIANPKFSGLSTGMDRTLILDTHEPAWDAFIEKAFERELTTEIKEANAKDNPKVQHMLDLINGTIDLLNQSGNEAAARFLTKMRDEGVFKLIDTRELIPQDGDVDKWVVPFGAHAGGMSVCFFDIFAEEGGNYRFGKDVIIEELMGWLGVKLSDSHTEYDAEGNPTGEKKSLTSMLMDAEGDEELKLALATPELNQALNGKALAKEAKGEFGPRTAKVYTTEGQDGDISTSPVAEEQPPLKVDNVTLARRLSGLEGAGQLWRTVSKFYGSGKEPKDLSAHLADTIGKRSSKGETPANIALAIGREIRSIRMMQLKRPKPGTKFIVFYKGTFSTDFLPGGTRIGRAEYESEEEMSEKIKRLERKEKEGDIRILERVDLDQEESEIQEMVEELGQFIGEEMIAAVETAKAAQEKPAALQVATVDSKAEGLAPLESVKLAQEDTLQVEGRTLGQRLEGVSGTGDLWGRMDAYYSETEDNAGLSAYLTRRICKKLDAGQKPAEVEADVVRELQTIRSNHVDDRYTVGKKNVIYVKYTVPGENKPQEEYLASRANLAAKRISVRQRRGRILETEEREVPNVTDELGQEVTDLAKERKLPDEIVAEVGRFIHGAAIVLAGQRDKTVAATDLKDVAVADKPATPLESAQPSAQGPLKVDGQTLAERVEGRLTAVGAWFEIAQHHTGKGKPQEASQDFSAELTDEVTRRLRKGDSPENVKQAIVEMVQDIQGAQVDSQHTTTTETRYYVSFQGDPRYNPGRHRARKHGPFFSREDAEKEVAELSKRRNTDINIETETVTVVKDELGNTVTDLDEKKQLPEMLVFSIGQFIDGAVGLLGDDDLGIAAYHAPRSEMPGNEARRLLEDAKIALRKETDVNLDADNLSRTIDTIGTLIEAASPFYDQGQSKINLYAEARVALALARTKVEMLKLTDVMGAPDESEFSDTGIKDLNITAIKDTRKGGPNAVGRLINIDLEEEAGRALAKQLIVISPRGRIIRERDFLLHDGEQLVILAIDSDGRVRSEREGIPSTLAEAIDEANSDLGEAIAVASQKTPQEEAEDTLMKVIKGLKYENIKDKNASELRGIIEMAESMISDAEGDYETDPAKINILLTAQSSLTNARMQLTIAEINEQHGYGATDIEEAQVEPVAFNRALLKAVAEGSREMPGISYMSDAEYLGERSATVNVSPNGVIKTRPSIGTPGDIVQITWHDDGSVTTDIEVHPNLARAIQEHNYSLGDDDLGVDSHRGKSDGSWAQGSLEEHAKGVDERIKSGNYVGAETYLRVRAGLLVDEHRASGSLPTIEEWRQDAVWLRAVVLGIASEQHYETSDELWARSLRNIGESDFSNDDEVIRSLIYLTRSLNYSDTACDLLYLYLARVDDDRDNAVLRMIEGHLRSVTPYDIITVAPDEPAEPDPEHAIRTAPRREVLANLVNSPIRMSRHSLPRVLSAKHTPARERLLVLMDEDIDMSRSKGEDGDRHFPLIVWDIGAVEEARTAEVKIRMTGINKAHLESRKKGPLANIVPEKQVIIPEELIPEFTEDGQKCRQELIDSLPEGSDVLILPLDEVIRKTSQRGADEKYVVLLNKEVLDKIKQIDHKGHWQNNCKATRVELTNYDFVHLEGALAVGRAILAGDNDEAARFYGLLRGMPLSADEREHMVRAIQEGNLALILPAIQRHRVDYRQLEKAALQFMKSA